MTTLVPETPTATVSAPTPRRRPVLSGLRKTGFIVAEIVGAILVWQAIVSLFSLDVRVLPGPWPVARSLWGLLSSGVAFTTGWVTIQETLLGFAVGAALGIVLAVLLTEFDLLGKIANPYIIAFQAMPKIAVAPLFLIWFGFGISSKVVLVVLLVFFPVLVNMMTGLRSVSSEQVELMLAYRASRWQTLRRLRWWAAMPFLFAAFEVSFVLALTAAVFAEILGSGSTIGLGTLIQLYTSRLDIAGMFGVVVILSVLGILLHAIVKLAGRYFLRWSAPRRG